MLKKKENLANNNTDVLKVIFCTTQLTSASWLHNIFTYFIF